MRYSKNAENAENLVVRFPISFLQMMDELAAKVRYFCYKYNYLSNYCKQQSIFENYKNL